MDNPNGLLKIIQENIATAWLIVIAVWGGLAKYLLQVKNDPDKRFSLIELIWELAISGFAGLLTLYSCMYLGFGFPLTAVLTGVAGNMGGQAIALIEHYTLNRIGIRIRNRVPPK